MFDGSYIDGMVLGNDGKKNSLDGSGEGKTIMIAKSIFLEGLRDGLSI